MPTKSPWPWWLCLKNLLRAQVIWLLWHSPHQAAHCQHQLHWLWSSDNTKSTNSHHLCAYETFLGMSLWLQQPLPSTMVTATCIIILHVLMTTTTQPSPLSTHNSGTSYMKNFSSMWTPSMPWLPTLMMMTLLLHSHPSTLLTTAVSMSYLPWMIMNPLDWLLPCNNTKSTHSPELCAKGTFLCMSLHPQLLLKPTTMMMLAICLIHQYLQTKTQLSPLHFYSSGMPFMMSFFIWFNWLVPWQTPTRTHLHPQLQSSTMLKANLLRPMTRNPPPTFSHSGTPPAKHSLSLFPCPVPFPPLPLITSKHLIQHRPSMMTVTMMKVITISTPRHNYANHSLDDKSYPSLQLLNTPTINTEIFKLIQHPWLLQWLDCMWPNKAQQKIPLNQWQSRKTQVQP